jgi:rRNA maturation RNase YbeY
VRENAMTHSSTIEIELLRVIIHGVLHLLGWGDKTDEQKNAMREKESILIEKFNNVPRGTLKK